MRRSSGQPVGALHEAPAILPPAVRADAPAALASPAGGSGRRPIGDPPGGTGARQAERSGAFAVGTTSPDLSVVIRQGSAGRGKPLPQCLPRERGRCPSAHTGADEVLDLSSGRFVNRPYGGIGAARRPKVAPTAGRGPMRIPQSPSQAPVTAPFRQGGLGRACAFPLFLHRFRLTGKAACAIL